MKSMKSSMVAVLMLLFVCSLTAQESKWPKMDASAMDAVHYPAKSAWRNYLSDADRNISPKIKLVYSRPMKKEREIFGALVPYGKEWRLGANEATQITFYQAVGIGDITLPRGVYTMSADVNQNQWDVHFSSQGGIWGAENRDKSMTVATATATPKMMENSEEALSMTFREMDAQTVHLVIQWDKTRVEIPIGLNPSEFEKMDVSPMDMSHYPSKSAYTNYLKGEEKDIKPKVKVTYSRPYKKERKVFGELLKTGDIWRVGANQSTEIQFFEDVKVGNLDLRRGTYALYAELKQGSWDMIFSRDIPAWGAANRDESKDVGRVNVPLSSESEVLENLSIIFEEKSDKKVHMVIGWDTTRAELPIEFK